jgi:AAA domain
MKSGRGHPHYKGGTNNHPSRSSSKNDDPNIRQRNYLLALIHKKEANVSNFHMANRFVEAMNTYSDKMHLLQMLDNSREFGSARLREVLSYLDTIQSVESLLIPILRNILTNETARPLMRRLRNRILMTLFTIPDLLEVLVELDAPSNLTLSSANLLCNFLMEISLAFVEARSSDLVRILAVELRKLGGIVKADCLCAILYVDENHNTSIMVASDAREGPVPWGSDFRPPGGRHDNDFLNFRDVRVFPTLNEIRSEIPNYLPMACGSNAIIQDLGQRLLDTNFRLLREDALFSMRECLAERRRPWKGAHIVDVHCKGNFRNENAICSLSFVIQCSANIPRKIDWERSNALSFGSIVALCHGQEVVRLGKISIRDTSRRDQWLNAPNGPQIGVTFLSEQEFNQSIKEMESNMVLREVGKLGFHQDKIEQTLKNDLVMYDLVEISQSFSTYEPILSAIQSMQEVPLMEELVHYSHTKPNYLPSKLNLPNDEFLKGATLDLQAWDTEQILKSTSLDVSQIDALHHTFTSRVSLIQGPPGTGKTFIGGAIARIIRENTNETILCVCYTNHALDQFLEHMLDAGETRLVRIGGRSRSSRITPYQLRELASRRNSFVSDRSRVRQIDAQLHKLHEQMDVLISQLKSTVTWTSPNGGVERHLLEHEDEDIGICFRIPHQAEYFTMVGKKNKKISKDVLLEAWLKGEDAPLWIYPFIEDYNFDIFHRYWDLSLSERWRLYEEWRHQVLDFKTFSLFNIIHEFNDRLSEKQDILRALDINVLNDARIVGVTTTGAAQYRDVLAHTDPGIVIIEEAGEVLEAHVLSSLRTSSKHLILIGDHKQLRPKTESYCLTTAAKKGYNLDQSLFERLILSRLSSISLCVQHRMCPQISEFIRTQTYPSLIDHDTVFKRPHVKGVTMDVAFINHNVPEDGQGDDDNNPKTKSNSYEAELCIEIVRFFLLQGYNPSDVVVLTPYLGQLFVITSLMKRELKEVSIYVSEKDTKELEILGSDELDVNDLHVRDPGMTQKEVRVSSIDNFQGEEANIIIASLVRSNAIGLIGFLKEPQRVNVLLSRARCGLFLIGNKDTLTYKSGKEVWKPIFEIIQDRGQLQDGLPTVCQLHPDDDPVVLKTKSDFRRYRPNGGCDRTCTFRMQCGHACSKACHPTDATHLISQKECTQPCRRFPPECNRNHICMKRCNQDCGGCQESVGPIFIPCGHVLDTTRCHLVRNDESLVKLTEYCRVSVPWTFENCKHVCETTCFNARLDVPKCPQKCDQSLTCGHCCTNE